MADEPRFAHTPPGHADNSTSFSIDPDLVARRAYDRYRMRGGEHGRDLQDWFEAERELIAAQLEEA